MIFPHKIEAIVYMSNTRLWNNRLIAHWDVALGHHLLMDILARDGLKMTAIAGYLSSKLTLFLALRS